MKDLKEISTEELLAEVERRKKEELIKHSYEKFKAVNDSPIGLWKVTTEGDCEGRTVRNLGMYKGHILDIAAELASSTMYVLNFKKMSYSYIEPAPVKKSVKTAITFDFATGCAVVDLKQRKLIFDRFIKERPSQYNYLYYFDDQTLYGAVGIRIVPEEKP